MDCWTGCEAPKDDTLNNKPRQPRGRVDESGGVCEFGCVAGVARGARRSGQTRGRRGERLGRNDEGPGPKSHGYPAICPASSLIGFRLATNMSISLFGSPMPPLLSSTVSHSPPLSHPHAQPRMLPVSAHDALQAVSLHTRPVPPLARQQNMQRRPRHRARSRPLVRSSPSCHCHIIYVRTMTQNDMT